MQQTVQTNSQLFES